MKLFHLSDLHLGKRVNELSMLEEQEHILEQILGLAEQEHPDGIIIAGDVYDKNVPSVEAVKLFDGFLVEASRLDTELFIISGNHDSPERLSFASGLLDRSGIHLSRVFDGYVEPYELHDSYGTVKLWLLPFIRPVNVRHFFPDEEINTYTDALRKVIEEMKIDTSERNVIVAHQFVTGAQTCDSETISVGGTDNVDSTVFSAFDYTALGHIHNAQNITDSVRYCGSPLKYSFSEAKRDKSVTIVELSEKGCLNLRTSLLTPIHDMRELRGSYDELTLRKNYEQTDTNAYVRITLTDEEDIPDASGKLRTIYKNLMKLDYDNTRTRTNGFAQLAEASEKLTPQELFAELYEKQNNCPMSESQLELVNSVFGKISEDEL